MKPVALTATRLRRILVYDPSTGVFTRLVASGSAKVGDRAGCVNATGYIVIRILDRLYLAHRLAWLYVYGRWPKEQIDHRDRDRSNNRFTNLREASNAQNQMNAKKKRGLSRYKGVSWREQTKRWQVHISINGRSTYLGARHDEEAARDLYMAAAVRHFGQFARPQ